MSFCHESFCVLFVFVLGKTKIFPGILRHKRNATNTLLYDLILTHHSCSALVLSFSCFKIDLT